MLSGAEQYFTEILQNEAFVRMIMNDISSSFHVAEWNLGQVNLEPMCPAVSMICGVAATACLALCLHVSCGRHNCSCLFQRSVFLDHYLGQITALVTIIICCLLA